MALRIPELLVPVGGRQQLDAAIANGADAVYMGGSAFNARAGAENFSPDEMRRAVELAHTYGVASHITMNILLREEELEPAVDFASEMYEAGADALIVQDPGLIARLRRELPDMPLHLSTQGTVYDVDGAKMAEVMGMKRVILARELSLEQIQEICRSVNIEVEVFVQGAICICYSGQCHLSGVIGSRSGNRGECAQPCRLPYELVRGEGKRTASGYLLSPADMSLLGSVGVLTDAGVDSLKIEGRMKSAEYVAAVTAAYRRQLDRIAETGQQESLAELAADTARIRQVFSRGSFTDAYLRGRGDGELMSVSSSKHTGIRIGELLRFDRKRRHALVKLTGSLANGDGIEIRDGVNACGNIITYIRGKSGKLIQEAEAGMTVEIGDLKWPSGGYPEKGAPLYRISRAALMKELRGSYGKHPSRIPVDFRLTAVTGAPAALTVSMESGEKKWKTSVVSAQPLEPARGMPPDEERIRRSLRRTGDTPYSLRSLKVKIAGDPFLPVSELNNMRREVLEKLTELRLDETRREKPERTAVKRETAADCAGEKRKAFGTCEQEERGPALYGKIGSVSKPSVTVYFYPIPGAEERIRELARMLASRPERKQNVEFAVPLGLLTADDETAPLAEELRALEIPVRAVLPAVTGRKGGAVLRKRLEFLESLYRSGGISGALAGNISHIRLLKERRIPFAADTSLNILNTAALQAVLEAGAEYAALSVEPDAMDSAPGGAFGSEAEVLIYGRIPVMHTAHCPVGQTGRGVSGGRPDCTVEKKCHYCRRDSWNLLDRKGAAFPVISEDMDCSSVIYSHRILNRLNKMQEYRLSGIRKFRICVFEEKTEIISEIVENI